MRAIITTLVLSLLVLSVIPGVLAVSIGTGVTPDITVEEFKPLVWMCDSRVLYDDATEPGRISPDGAPLLERFNNYAFEGEQISWLVLVMDKNKIDQNIDVYGTVGPSQGEGNDIEVNCNRVGWQGQSDFDKCNARILEEKVQWDEDLMDFFECTLTVETPKSAYGEYWVTVEAQDATGLMGTMDENEFWFFNPVIALSIDGDLTFEDVRPGTSSYSNTLLVGNDADDGSGVMLDMFISGTDFYDSSSSAARCPTTNQLNLEHFRYFATNGAYSTSNDLEIDLVGGDVIQRDRDSEGYVNIDYGIGWNNPNAFYDNMEILQQAKVGAYYGANMLAPGAEMALTFKLKLPEPCNGNFDTGSIYFWGEAV
jgi:hypothetical protein